MTHHKLHSCSSSEQLEDIVLRIYYDLSSCKSIEGLIQKTFSNLTYTEIVELSFIIKDIIQNNLDKSTHIKQIVLAIEYINMKNNNCDINNLEKNRGQIYPVCFSNNDGRICKSQMNGITQQDPNCKKMCQNVFSECGVSENDECNNFCYQENTDIFSECINNSSIKNATIKNLSTNILVPLVTNMLNEINDVSSIENLLNKYFVSLKSYVDILAYKIKEILKSGNSKNLIVQQIVLEIENVMMNNIKGTETKEFYVPGVMGGNYYGSIPSSSVFGNGNLYCSNNTSNNKSNKLYGKSNNTSNYLYVNSNYTLSFINNGNIFNITTPLQNPLGNSQPINGNDVNIMITPWQGIVFYNSNMTINWFFNSGNNVTFTSLVYDDVNVSVYLTTNTGNVYLYGGNVPGVIVGNSPGVIVGNSPGVMRGNSPGVIGGNVPGVIVGNSPGVMRGNSPGVIGGNVPGVNVPGVIVGNSPGVMRGNSPRVIGGNSPGVMRGNSPGPNRRNVPGVMRGNSPGPNRRNVPGVMGGNVPGVMGGNVPGVMGGNVPGTNRRNVPGVMRDN